MEHVSNGLVGMAGTQPRATRLSRFEHAVLVACTEALLPAGGAIQPSGLEARVVPYVEQMVSRVPRMLRLLVRALLLFVEFCPWLRLKARLTRLGVPERMRILRGLSESRIYLLRSMFISLRALLTIAYFADEGVCQALGQPWVPGSPLHGAAA